MRPMSTLALLLACAGTAEAAECRLSQARYSDGHYYELQFRPMQRQDQLGMTSHVFEVTRPALDARRFDGSVSGQMGTSRPEGVLSYACPDDPDAAALAECIRWTGVIYALGPYSATPLPNEDQAAPRALLLSDFGRQVRYSGVVRSPGEEPNDVFTLIGCRP